MRRKRDDEALYRDIARELGVDVADVRRAVFSFFDAISLQAKAMPFDNIGRIYSMEKFLEWEKVTNIPSIGRIGPVYSRYLRWRANASQDYEQKARSAYRSRMSQDDIEHMAEAILSGNTPPSIHKRKGSELYNRVWLVGKTGKKLARQVIPKKKTDVQD